MRQWKGGTEQGMRELAQQDAKDAALAALGRFKCQCCYEQASLPAAKVPTLFEDHYMDVCDACATELMVVENRLISWEP